MTDIEVAKEIQNQEIDDYKRNLAADEWAGIDLANKLTQEERDMLLAEELFAEERKFIEKERKEREEREANDAKIARAVMEEFIQEDRKKEREKVQIMQKDLHIASNLQSVEDELTQLALQKNKEKAAQLEKVNNWEDPEVKYVEDADNNCLCLKVILPDIKTLKAKVEETSDKELVIHFHAASADSTKKFDFDINLNSENPFTVSSKDIIGDIDRKTNTLMVKINGLQLNKLKDESTWRKIKNTFSFLASPAKEITSKK